MSHLVIAGIGGGVQPRLEINNFVRDDRQFSLYVQALSECFFLVMLTAWWLMTTWDRQDVRR